MRNFVRIPNGTIINLDKVYRIWPRVVSGERYICISPGPDDAALPYQTLDTDGKIYGYFRAQAGDVEWWHDWMEGFGEGPQQEVEKMGKAIQKTAAESEL